VKAATIAAAISGFASTGVWPVDRDVCHEHHLSSSAAMQVVSENVPTASNEDSATRALPEVTWRVKKHLNLLQRL
jgi:hypothetical protein